MQLALLSDILKPKMAPGSSDEPQKSMGSGFPGSGLYPNTNIWTSSLSNTRERSAVNNASNKGKDPEGSPSGSSALAADSEADWSSHPWKNTMRSTRSVSSSPNRNGKAPAPNHSGYYEHATPSAIGIHQGSFGGSSTPPSNGTSYGPDFRSQQRQEIAAGSSCIGSHGIYPQGRHSIYPYSGQSHASPALQAFYRGHNTPRNADHSQRTVGGNQRTEQGSPFQLGCQVALDHAGPSGATLINSAPSFQLNPGSQPWMSDAINSMHLNPSPAQYNKAMKRPSIDQVAPASNDRVLNVQHHYSPRYAASFDAWSAQPSSRAPRLNDLERRSAASQFPQVYDPSLYYHQYAYPNIVPQYTPSLGRAQNPLSMYGPASINQGLGQGNINIIQPAAAYAMVPAPYHHAVAGAHSSALPSSGQDQDPDKPLRSVALQTFYACNKSVKRYEIKDLYGHIVEFSGDQAGSRFLQNRLDTANSEEKEHVYREIEPNALQLTKDVFGNYIVQKIFEHGNQVQKRVLADKMKGKVVDLSVQLYACRVVQKAIEHVLVDQQLELTMELEPEIMRVIRDPNGNHVVQKVIQVVPRKHLDFIMDALRGQVGGLASHIYGCRVIQRMLEYGTETDKVEIMTELHPVAQRLITDRYGNYVVQHVISRGKAADRNKMIGLVMTKVLLLSNHKYSSNVVEKCIECGSVEQRCAIRDEITTVANNGTMPIQQMMRDQYGNYVIQRLLAHLKGKEREVLVKVTKPLFYAMKKNGMTRQLTALEYPLGFTSVSPGNSPSNSPAKGPAKDPAKDPAKSPGSSPRSSPRSSPHSSPRKNKKKKGSFSPARGNSTFDTPALTNGSISPQSSSPRSARVSNVDISTDDGSKCGSEKHSRRVNPQLREEEA
ncbi:hypothetical protein E4U09_006540 [Claviceps aff. purpurea]|uniref:PUM-HD domain-containing protein n=1 Tax=Claviceps aff. purpurea TaxID=1967640 RepID=A0A9P7QTU5_9HYPO|nr:hypothetical protein E4U09_006540 [Claviceps aff. purpurea]